jgi:beta-lactam-binding protein with PASTA domain/predicted Ser/Thr protein kinase
MEEPRRLGDRYELGPVLGRGGMAEVHMARDIRLGRTVAVKMLRVDLARDPTFQARFRREAQSAASLNHPSIVAVYDTGEDVIDGLSLPYIVMEYVNGSTLRELVQSGRRLLPERAMEITAGVLQALEYSHRNGIVHRDIKPGNVMLTRQGAVKVMDFGIARAVADTAATMTQTAAVIGTAQYLSPEQAKGEPVDARSDLYSTGCLLYELLTGRPPFVGDSPVSVAYQHVREDPMPPSQLDPELNAGIDRLVLTALAKNPDNRYQSADDMRADIERAIEGRPVAAPALMPDATQRIAPMAATGMYEPVSAADEEPAGNRKAGYALLALAVIAIFLGALFLGRSLLTSNDAGGRKTGVPNVIDQPVATAKQQLANDGFTNVAEQRSANDARAGTVFDQSPKPDTLVTKDQLITLFVSTGPQRTETTPPESPTETSQAPKKVTVPPVQGFSRKDAIDTIQAKRLKADPREVDSNEEKGKVFRTDPDAGTEVDVGSTVTLFISKGQSDNGQVEVPDVVTLPKDEAEKQLKDAGFKVETFEVLNPQAQPGTVFSQQPQGGTKRKKGTTVRILVATGDGGGNQNGNGLTAPDSPPSDQRRLS